MPLSVTVITFNESANIQAALESVRWADEIVVVDSESTDDTVAIARRFTDKVFVRPWPGYVAQKTFAAEQATHDWVLSIDADEAISPPLAAELRALLAGTPPLNGYQMPRVTFHLGRWIRSTDWYPNYQLRLYDRRRARWTGKYVHESEGYNGRLHAIQAAFLRIKLRHLSRWNDTRRQVAAWYRDALGGVPEVQLPVEASYSEHVYHLYVIRTPQRDALREHLASRRIGNGLHYPGPLHLQRAYSHLELSVGSLPVTEQAAATCISLPMFPEMTRAQVDQVADAVRAFMGSR